MEREGIIKDLETFLEELRKYYYLRREMEQRDFISKELDQVRDLRLTLVKKGGKYKKLIAEITGIEIVSIFMNNQEFLTDIWSVGLLADFVRRTPIALGYCTDSVGQAIGKLEDEITKGKRDAQTGELVDKSGISKSETPKAFIAHGGRSGVLDKLREFIQALGIDPLIVDLLPTKGMSVDDKVNKYIKDADCGIVLATGGGIVEKKSEKQHPRLNVIDEFERLRTVFPDKTILLLEKRGVDLPSNISGLTYEPFVRQSMDRAFTAIARELTDFGILKTVKPKTE